ncbi:MAG: hypothetical protein AAFR54_11455 [Planctomycetota bacterium]
MTRAPVEVREEHLQGFARSFILKDRQVRFLEFMRGRRKGRPKKANRWHELLSGLEHWADLGRTSKSPRIARALEIWDVDALSALSGADRCYVMTDDEELDDRVLPIRDALASVGGRRKLRGAILSVKPGTLAIYEQSELVALRRWFERP